MRYLLQVLTTEFLMITPHAHQECYQSLMNYHSSGIVDMSAVSDSGRGSRDSFCDLTVFGPTTHRFSGFDANCNSIRCYRDIRSDLKAALDNPDIDRIFIEFCGPGGEGEGCFDTADYMVEVAKKKPVIGFINGCSFSANYALAAACTELYITPHSLGGSIGAISARVEQSIDGLKVHYFTSGEAKADGQPFLEMTAAEAERRQKIVNDAAGSFFNHVASQRGLTVETVSGFKANIFTAEEMLGLGLVDGIKTEEEMIQMMTDATHNRIVGEMKAQHETEMQAVQAENVSLQQQITQVKADAAESLKFNQELLQKVDTLAQSAGVGDVATKVALSSATVDEAAEKIKVEAAKRDEEILLTSTVDHAGTDDSYDMLALIREA